MRQKTETMLCAAFMELLKKYPFSKITIQKLAGQCGVNRQTFYYHFDNIYDLMSKAFEYELVYESRIYEEVNWEYVMSGFLRWLKEHRAVIRNILANAELPYLKRAIYPLVARSISDISFSSENLQFAEKQREDFCINFLTIGITQYVLEWVESDFREPIEDIVAHMSWFLQKVYS
nr:TetR/AcrR family transcriptional regulator C-terminal domain-containing protein [uncultured Anaerobutyricum sp.]